jgi:HSP20 family protein
MGIRKGKEGKVPTRKKERGEITEKRPFELWTDFDRLFDQFRRNFTDLFLYPMGRITPYTETRAPPMDVIDHGNRYEMQVEMPGIPKEDIDIEVTPYGVEISAEQEISEEEKGKNWLRQERGKRGFYRCVDFPEELKTEEVDAELKEGILTLSLPKTEPAPGYEGKKVKVK